MINVSDIASLLGYFGLAFLYIQAVFGSRHIFKYLTTNTVIINQTHKLLGIYGFIFIFLHPIVELISKNQNLFWLINITFTNPAQAALSFGKIAFLLSLAVWLTSAIVREKIKWRPWKFIHLLAYPTLFFAFIHIPQIGSWFEVSFLIKAIWMFGFLSFIFTMFWRLKYWASFGKVKYKIIEEKLVGEDILLIKLQTLGDKIQSNIGQHFYLQTDRFASEHPFSIIRNEDGILSFGIRKSGKFWDKILDKKLGEIIYVDGPYGVFTKQAQNTNPKVIISAGIGVTPFIDLVEKFGGSTIYINCNRRIEEVIERENLKSKVSEYFDILENVDGKISAEMIRGKLGDRLQDVNYFVCGSPNFVKFIKQTLQDLEISKSKIFIEELGY